MSREFKITVIGGGNGAFATAADLALRNFNVILCELPKFKDNIKSISKTGGISLEALDSSGLKSGFAKIDTITTDFCEALADAKVIFIVVPAFGQNDIAKMCAPFLKDGQIIVLCPGGFFGSINFSNVLKEMGCEADLKIAEAESMMYACRKKDDYSVWIRGFKHKLGIALFPEKDSDNAFSTLKEIYPNFCKRNNVIETSFSNVNPILHIPIMLFNLSNIDNEIDCLFYHKALTNSICKVVEALDKERMAINRIEGINIKPILEIVKAFYSYQGAHGNTLCEFFNSNPIYRWSKLPITLHHRYIMEDVPFGLIPMYSFAKQFHFNNTTMKSLIDISCIATNIDFYPKARDMDKLGLGSFSEEQLINYIFTGKE